MSHATADNFNHKKLTKIKHQTLEHWRKPVCTLYAEIDIIMPCGKNSFFKIQSFVEDLKIF